MSLSLSLSVCVCVSTYMCMRDRDHLFTNLVIFELSPDDASITHWLTDRYKEAIHCQVNPLLLPASLCSIVIRPGMSFKVLGLPGCQLSLVLEMASATISLPSHYLS